MKKIALIGENFYIDGKPFLVCGAEIQYYRMDPEYWDIALSNAKAAGVNLISTYVPWYFHEETEGCVDLLGKTGAQKDMRRFFQLACRHGLYISARPGPFINSELRYGGFPGWLFEKYPETLTRNASGNYGTGRPCPAEGEPLYREKVFRWYDAVIPLIAEFQDQEQGGVILFQPDNELSSAWSFGLLNSLYDPTVLSQDWPGYLHRKYGSVEQMNRAYETDYKRFSEADAPRRFPVSIPEKKRCADWMNFKREFFADWGITLARYAMKLGIHVPITLNEPVAGFFNHGDHSGVGARIQQSGLPMFTSCHTYSDRLQDWDGCADNNMSVQLNRSSPLQAPGLAVEAGAGCYNDRMRKSDINWDMLLRNNLMGGLAGSVIYAFSDGYAPLEHTIEGPQYWPGAPLSAEGTPNRLTGRIGCFHRFVHGWEQEIADAACPEELNIAFSAGMRLSDFLGTYPLLQQASMAGPGGERFTAEPKIDRGEVSFSHDWLDGYEGVSKQTVQVESSAWRKVREAMVLSTRLGLSGRMVDLSAPCVPSSDPTPLLVPNAGCLEEEAFAYLADYIRKGGTAIFTPMIPQYDLFGNRNDSLLRLLGAELKEMIRPAGGAVLDYGSRPVQTAYGQELSVHSWITAYAFPGKQAATLASYQGRSVASSVSVEGGKAIVVGFEAIFNNRQSARFWASLLGSICGVSPAAKDSHGCFSLFLRRRGDFHALAVGNAAGSLEPGEIHCAGYTFPLELSPHEGRILLFHAPIMDGKNQLCYCTSELIPLSENRHRFELHGGAGTDGALVLRDLCSVTIDGAPVQPVQTPDGWLVTYRHQREPLVLELSESNISPFISPNTKGS